MGKVLCYGKWNHSLIMPVASARKAGALIYKMIEDMKFSYEEKMHIG